MAALAVIAMLVVTGCDENFGWGWGLNISGQVGDGTSTTTSTPVPVSTTGALAGKGLIDISAGHFHSCALATDGTVACWGSNANGELGAPVPNPSLVPVAVVLPAAVAGKRITQVSAGNSTTCVLASDGTVACWGLLGASQIVGPLAGSPVVEVSVGWSHACVRTALGAMACWGNNNQGQLGNSTFNSSPRPVLVTITAAIAGKKIPGITAGDFHNCALASDGTAACWGANANGELGNNSTVNSNVPVPVSATGALTGKRIVQISGGQRFTCATTADGIATCWGWNARGQLGNPAAGAGSLTAFAVDATGVLAGKRIEQVSAGHWHACAMATDGTPACWGYTDMGQLGDGVDLSQLPPNSVKFYPVFVVNSFDPPLLGIVTGFFSPNPSGGATSGTDVFNGAERRIYSFNAPGGAPIPPGGTLKVNVNTGAPPPAVPITAAAVNVTVTGTTGSGVLTVAKDASTTTSTINWSGPNQTIANAVITNAAPDGTITITNNGSTPALVIVDLTGTFSPVASGATGARYWALDPSRTYDSRIVDGPLAAGQSRITSHPVPVDATAILVNTTITGTTGTGYLTLGEPTLGPPQTSTVNWFKSPTTRANGSIVTTNGHATRAFVGGSNTTQYVIDVGGYFR